MVNTEETNGLLMHGNQNTSTVHNTEMKEIMQILQNQTTELENLKKQAEIDRSTIKLLLNQSIKLENLKKQVKNKSQELDNLKRETENDRSTIKRLLNQSIELEQKVETYTININSLPTQNQNLIQNMTTNEENDKKVTDRLNDVVKHMTDLNVQVRYKSLSLLDIQTMAEEINGSMMQQIEQLIASMNQTFFLNHKEN